MSKFSKSKASACQCSNSSISGGSINLTVQPTPGSHSRASLSKAGILQKSHLPHLESVQTTHHMGSEHAHPVDMKALSSHALHNALNNHNLTLRLAYTPHDYTKPSVCTEVSETTLQALFRDGAVAIDAPLQKGEFRLHSTRPGQITGAEFIAS